LHRLALVAALNVLHSLPEIHGSADLSFRQHLKTKQNFLGFVNPSAVQDPVVLTPLRDYHSIHNDNHFNLIDGSFHFIVDTGCSMSCSPCEKDFSELRYLL
jgi:hypothetical protein